VARHPLFTDQHDALRASVRSFVRVGAPEAVQVHGGYGFMKEFRARRAWRDARLDPIGGGATQILKELIGRSYGL
jgi:acyl-CoA dehydrogenase-like protein